MASTSLIVLCFVLAATSIAVETRTLRVTTVLLQPFARYKSVTALPHELEGYIPDLLDAMKDSDADLNFKVTPVEDGKYGSRTEDASWDGVIGKLSKRTADLAAAPLTVTTDRATAVKFLEPAFMTFDLAILMRKRDMSSDIQSIADLNKATKFTYAVVDGGSTYTFFQYKQAYSVTWSKVQDNTVPSVEDGVKRVLESNDNDPYLFIGEQQMLEYHANQKPCDLAVVKGNETGGAYQLAIRPADYHDIGVKLEAALSTLNETGRLDELYNKWFMERSECIEETASGNSSSAMLSSMTAILITILLAIMLRVNGQ